ncbi:dihydrofolate reductase, partial [Shewanella sp. 0m-11]
RQADLVIEGVTTVTSFEQAKLAAGDCAELVVIGGGQLYEMLLAQADILYLTEIALTVEGDTFFPEWNDGSWQEVSRDVAKNDKQLEYSFIKLVKKC